MTEIDAAYWAGWEQGRKDAAEAVRTVVLQERPVSRLEVISAAAGDFEDPPRGGEHGDR